MSNSQNNTPDTPQAVQNEFNTYMVLRDAGVDKDVAQRGADHVRRGTNKGGDEGATSAAVQVLRWLGLFAAIVAIVLGVAQYVSAKASAKVVSTNIITLPLVSSDCRIKCSSSVPMPTITPTAFVGVPPMLPTPTAPAADGEVQ